MVSRHQFVWPTFAQTTGEVIAGFEAAWRYFGGIFSVVIPDSMKAIVTSPTTSPPASTTRSWSTRSSACSRVEGRGGDGHDCSRRTHAKKASRLSAVVVRFSRSRERYERQGLVEEQALVQAEHECLADEDARHRRRLREEQRRAEHDVEFEADSRRRKPAVAQLFPGCPP